MNEAKWNKDQVSSCWLTDDLELHPETDCLVSGDWLMVATNGRERWVNCSQCNGSWGLPNEWMKPNDKESNDA